jgi:2-keto-4-pentenoate hydratase/2-oxohepta-3-ene-1,7-dioic acid hydratase in catechol pathway
VYYKGSPSAVGGGLGPAKGKDFDGAHVLGPVLVTADEIPDPYDLTMTATVTDEAWTTGSTGAMHWRFEQMIAHASRSETLRPVEVFGSGTVGAGSAAEVGRTLHAGDVVELTVDRLGTLRNTVVAAPNG